MKTITSRLNKEIKLVHSLRNTKSRKKHNAFIAEGVRTVATLVKANQTLQQLYVTQHQLKAAEKLVVSNNITLVDAHVMEKISTATTPSGIVGVFEIPAQPSTKQLNAGLVIARIHDPGNMGTLIRSTAAFSFNTVVVIEGVDPWSPKVVQASAGAIGCINLFRLSWDELLQNKKDLNLCALVVKHGKKPEELNFKESLLVVGSEAHGLPVEWIKQCKQKLTLPMPGKTESLNAAVAGSVALYTMRT